MPFAELPNFFQELNSVPGNSASALMFMILTATRTGEVLGAKWQEIDLDGGCWTIPAARMKAKREHRVPLAPSVVDLLRMRVGSIQETRICLLDPKRGRPLEHGHAKDYEIYGLWSWGQLGNFVPHGFRSSFRDWAGEVSSYPAT